MTISHSPVTIVGSTSKDKFLPAFSCMAILTVYILFTIVFVPSPAPGRGLLSTNDEIFETATRFLAHDWGAFLLPKEYETGEFLWVTTSIVITTLAEKYLGAFTGYLLLSTAFVITTFVLAWLITRSLCFSATLCFMLAFGTQLNYAYTYGDLIAFYVLLTYVAVNFSICVLLVSGRLRGWKWSIAFILSLCLAALSTEWWINYATALIAAAGFGIAWGARHGNAVVRTSSTFLLLATIIVLGIYLAVRLQTPGQFLRHGAEEELLITYQYFPLLAEDFIVNFFTLLYVSLTNYLPSFFTSSNSLTYLGASTIIAEQYGYDPAHQQLVLMNHLFLWRFYAGVAATIFLGWTGVWVYRAWKAPSLPALTIAALNLMVIAGFSTHLLIKMRPYNSVPGLPYKATISIAALTVLIAYLTMLCGQRLRSRRFYYGIIACVWGTVSIAAITRPGMQRGLLAEVGLVGLRDPFGQILDWLR